MSHSRQAGEGLEITEVSEGGVGGRTIHRPHLKRRRGFGEDDNGYNRSNQCDDKVILSNAGRSQTYNLVSSKRHKVIPPLNDPPLQLYQSQYHYEGFRERFDTRLDQGGHWSLPFEAGGKGGGGGRI